MFDMFIERRVWSAVCGGSVKSNLGQEGMMDVLPLGPVFGGGGVPPNPRVPGANQAAPSFTEPPRHQLAEC